MTRSSSTSAGAALDVTDPEPLPPDHPLWRTPGVLISPHTGGATTAFPRRAAAYVTRQIEAFVRTGGIEHVVATGDASTATGTGTAPWVTTPSTHPGEDT